METTPENCNVALFSHTIEQKKLETWQTASMLCGLSKNVYIDYVTKYKRSSGAIIHAKMGIFFQKQTKKKSFFFSTSMVNVWMKLGILIGDVVFLFVA